MRPRTPTENPGRTLRIKATQWHRTDIDNLMVWEEITEGCVWDDAYMPYQDEPLRCSGSSLVQSSDRDDAIRALLNRRDRVMEREGEKYMQDNDEWTEVRGF